MKRIWIVTYALLFVSVAGLAQTPGQAPLTREALAAILSESAFNGSCATQEIGVPVAAKRPRMGPEKAACTATAVCETSTVSCSGTSTCTTVDRNCDNGERGRVTCNGVTTLCPTRCPCGLPACCNCDRTGDCIACCRCSGGTIMQCNAECG